MGQSIYPVQSVVADVVPIEVVLPAKRNGLHQVQLLINECAGVVHLVTDPTESEGLKIPSVGALDAAFPAGNWVIPQVSGRLYLVAATPTSVEYMFVDVPGTAP